jgi:hypothetical protein
MFTVTALAVVALLLGSASAATADDSAVYYLALGDSVAQG